MIITVNEYSFGDIYIRHAIDESPNDRYFHMHIHERCEMFLFISGNVEYLVEGSRYPLDEKSLMIMRPAESHKAKIIDNSRFERYAINFPTSFMNSLDPEGRLMNAFINRTLGHYNLFTSTELDMPLVYKLIEEMCSEADDYSKKLTINTHLLILLDMISRAFVKKEAIQHKPRSDSERMVIYVNNHLFEELSVPMLAQHFYLSTSQFNRIFKQATGAAPWEYIIKKRLTAAKEKIRLGSSAHIACESCGFGDYSSFYRAYIKHFGCAPKNTCDK